MTIEEGCKRGEREEGGREKKEKEREEGKREREEEGERG